MLHVSNDPSAEADWLCRLISEHAEALTSGRLGAHFQLAPASFRLHSRGRNTIYRVSGRFHWFLKLPRGGDEGPILRERLGAENTARALGELPEYCAPTVVRISARPGFVLTTAIPGESLNRVALTRTWIPGERAGTHVERCFANLGMLLARLHKDGRVTTDLPDATTTPYQTLRIMLAKVDEPDSIVDTIRTWCETRPGLDDRADFVHGNMRMNNVLAVGTRLAFIDFENCGRGSVYQDVSRPVSELLLTHCLWAFPHRRATRFLSAFLHAYASHHAYDPSLLWDSVGARVARYYLEFRTRAGAPARIGGLPVRGSCLRELTDALMSNRLHRLIPDLSLPV